MTTIWEQLDSALTPLGLPFGADGWMAATGVDIPAQYLVYLEIAGVGQQFADNTEKSRLHHVQVSYYSKTGFSGANLTALFGAMKTAGFIKGPETPLPYNSNDRMFGLALEFNFLEEE
jgi:dihydrodipicolinate synthase/N-acetylneuraminate lyase